MQCAIKAVTREALDGKVQLPKLFETAVVMKNTMLSFICVVVAKGKIVILERD